MDGLKGIFAVLVLVFLVTLVYLHRDAFPSRKPNVYVKEGFDTGAESTVESTIRAALDPYLNDDLCSIYTELRVVLAQMIQGNDNPPTADTLKKVEAYLTTELTVPPLPCPAFTYPSGSDIDWLNFLNGIPPEIGGTFVLMIVYAQRELAFRVKNIKTALARGTPVPETDKDKAELIRMAMKIMLSSLPTEGFDSIIGICPMNVQDTRRMENAAKSCIMPDDMTQDEIVSSVNTLLQTIKEKKSSLLASKYISPDLDIAAFLKDAKASSDYLKLMKAKAMDGSLAMEMAPAQ